MSIEHVCVCVCLCALYVIVLSLAFVLERMWQSVVVRVVDLVVVRTPTAGGAGENIVIKFRRRGSPPDMP